MLLDLHNHTQYSPDSRVAPGQLVAVAQRMGLAGIAITDHNAVGGIRAAEAAASGSFLVIPAIEVSTEAGHVLGYGIRDLVPRDRSVAETAERIVALGGVLQVLGQGRTAAHGIDRGASATVRYVTKCVGQWFLRGMRRI